MIQSLVQTVLQTHVLTASQARQINSYLLQAHCNPADLEALDALTDALNGGTVHVSSAAELTDSWLGLNLDRVRQQAS